MERGPWVALLLVLLLAGAGLVFWLDGPVGPVAADEYLAALWETGGQAGAEAFVQAAPAVALFGSGRVVAGRDRRWYQGAVPLPEVERFGRQMQGAGLPELTDQIVIGPGEVGVAAPDAGELHVRLRLDGREWDLRSTVPLPLLERRLEGRPRVRAMVEAVRALRALGAQAQEPYVGPLDVQVSRVDELPPGESAAAWPAAEGVVPLRDYMQPAEAGPSEAGSSGNGQPEPLPAPPQIGPGPWVREVWVLEARRLAGPLFNDRWFREDEFLYRVDYRPLGRAW